MATPEAQERIREWRESVRISDESAWLYLTKEQYERQKYLMTLIDTPDFESPGTENHMSTMASEGHS